MPTAINTGKLESLIREKYKTQAAFAAACGVSRQFMTQILKGNYSPSLERAIQFAELLGCSLDDIVMRKWE